MAASYISLRAVGLGLLVLIGLSAMYVLLGGVGLFGASAATGRWTLALFVAVLLYVCAGYVAGVSAGHHQVLNASAVGLVFGLLVWFALRLAVVGGAFDDGALSANGVALSSGAVAMLACGIGGILSIVLPYHRRRDV